MTLNIQQFESMLPKSASDNSRHSLRSAIMIANGFSDKASEIRSDSRLSDEGKREELTKLKAATSTNGHLVQIRTSAERQLNSIKSERETFRAAVLKPPSDALAEARHAEIRSMLRALPETERVRVAMEDSAVRDAAAVAPPVLSGVPAPIHAQIIDGLVETHFRSRSAELAADQEEAEVVLAAATVASDFIARS